MAAWKKLSDEQERDVALCYLCDVNLGYIRERWNVARSTIMRLILGERSPAWNDPLVEFYKQTDSRRRSRNHAHLYLAFHDQPELAEMVSEKDNEVYQAVKSNIYDPEISRILDETSLEKYVAPKTGEEKFIWDVFEYPDIQERAWEIADSVLVDKLYQAYQKAVPNGRIYFSKVCEDVKSHIIDKVRKGGLAITNQDTPIKKTLMKKVMNERLTPGERGVLISRYGLFGNEKLILLELGNKYGFCKERIRQKENDGLRKLQEPNASGWLKMLTGLKTDFDVAESVEEIAGISGHTWQTKLFGSDKSALFSVYPGQVSEYLETPIDSFVSLSSSTKGYLKGIETIEDLIKYTRKDLLNKGFSDESISEIRDDLLIPAGLNLKPRHRKRYKKPTVKTGYDINLSKLDFKTRAVTVFHNQEIETLKQLIGMTEYDLLKFRSIGLKTLYEIKKTLAGLGLSLRREYSKKIYQKPTVKTGYDVNLIKLDFSCRACNALWSGDITTLDELLEKTEDDLLKFRHLGEITLNEIKGKLSELGLSLKES